MALLCYIDTSAILTMALEQDGHEQVRRRYDAGRRRGHRYVSSQLVELECRRVHVRESSWLSWDVLGQYLNDLDIFDLGPADWEVAMHGIPHHVRSLDALHLAACLNVRAALFACDRGLNEVASALGVERV